MKLSQSSGPVKQDMREEGAGKYYSDMIHISDAPMPGTGVGF